MLYRQLGSSELKVSEIAYGSWLNVSEGAAKEKAVACLHRAFDCGINFIDTANVYAGGAAERILGEALTGTKRDSYILATKLYFPMSRTDKGLSRGQVFKQIDASLSRLKVDYVDLYQCHRYDADTPLEETLHALTEIVQAGKVRYIGFSEWPVDRVQESIEVPRVEKFVSSQPQYSLLHRGPEKELLPLCEANGISQVVWSPLAQGILTGKYLAGGRVPGDSRAANSAINGFISPAWLKPTLLSAIESLRPIAAAHDLSLAQFALAWVLRQPNVAAAIIGASRPEQIEENAKASGRQIPPESFAQAERLLARALQ